MEAMAGLRRAKREAALAIAIADIAGWWNLDQVIGALTRFADAAVKGALCFLLRRAASLHNMPERDGAALEAESGLTVLAMGKYLSLIHISEPTRQAEISYAVFCLKKKK